VAEKLPSKQVWYSLLCQTPVVFGLNEQY
jgi:hypothetical protein